MFQFAVPAPNRCARSSRGDAKTRSRVHKCVSEKCPLNGYVAWLDCSTYVHHNIQTNSVAFGSRREHVSANPDDLIRDAILRHLHDVHRKAKSVKSAAILISTLQKSLKQSHGFKQQEVASNLDYLVQKGWVREIVEDRSFRTKRGTEQSAQRRTYKISDTGIDRLQRASVFQRTNAAAGINITNIRGVTVIGDGNVVSAHYTDLSRALSELKSAVHSAPRLADEQKLSAIADIDALQAQLQKPEPNKSIVKLLWASIEKAVVAAGFVELVRNVELLVAPLLD